LAAALVALAATPAMAQEARLTATGMIQTGQVIEEMACTGNEVRVQLDRSQPRDTIVHVFAITQSGPNRFRDAPGRLVPNSETTTNPFSSGGSVRIPAGSTSPVNTGICWRNDIIDSPGSSEVLWSSLPMAPATPSPRHKAGSSSVSLIMTTA